MFIYQQQQKIVDTQQVTKYLTYKVGNPFNVELNTKHQTQWSRVYSLEKGAIMWVPGRKFMCSRSFKYLLAGFSCFRACFYVQSIHNYLQGCALSDWEHKFECICRYSWFSFSERNRLTEDRCIFQFSRG